MRHRERIYGRVVIVSNKQSSKVIQVVVKKLTKNKTHLSYGNAKVILI